MHVDSTKLYKKPFSMAIKVIKKVFCLQGQICGKQSVQNSACSVSLRFDVVMKTKTFVIYAESAFFALIDVLLQCPYRFQVFIAIPVVVGNFISF